jgi:hypothetical protein
LCAEVVVEGEGFDEFLDAAADLALVAPAVYAELFGDDGFEELVDLVEAVLIFLGDFGWEGLVGCADSLEGEDAEDLLVRCNSLFVEREGVHLLAQSCDVAALFDDSLASVMMFVQLVAEVLEH